MILAFICSFLVCQFAHSATFGLPKNRLPNLTYSGFVSLIKYVSIGDFGDINNNGLSNQNSVNLLSVRGEVHHAGSWIGLPIKHGSCDWFLIDTGNKKGEIYLVNKRSLDVFGVHPYLDLGRGGIAKVLVNHVPLKGNPGRRRHDVGRTQSDPSSLPFFKVLNSSASDPPRLSELPVIYRGDKGGQQRIDNHEDQSGQFDSKSLLVAGVFLFIGGCVLLQKVWWNLSFNYVSLRSATWHVSLVVLCAVLMGSGVGLALASFGIFSHY